jgi:hemolysin activation/secretion protein
VAATTLLSLGVAQAQVAPINGGQLLQQVQPKPSRPSGGETGLNTPAQSGLPTANGGPAFEVNRIVVKGNTLLSDQEIQAITAPAQGKKLTLGQLDKLAAQLTALYQAKGYTLSYASVPPQAVHQGVVTISVMEARYGGIKFTNTSKVKDGLVQETLAPIRSGQIITKKTLNRSLLLLGDIPGVIARSTLSPGAEPGTSNLSAVVTPGPAYNGNVGVDNAGSRYTGRARLSANLNLNNPLHHGDQISLSGVTSGAGMNYGRLGYQAIVNGQGTRVGVAVSALHYKLMHGEFSSLGAHGTAQMDSVWINHPIVRGVNANLYGQLEYDHKILKDAIDASGMHNDRTTDGISATLAGDARDAHGITNYSATLGLTRVAFTDTTAQARDAAGPDTQGRAASLLLSVSRLQQLSENNALYLGATGQLASANLDPSNQFVLGGPGSVRAYDIGTIAGSQGAFATAEFRHNLNLSWHGQWQFIAFGDAASVQIYRSPFAGSGLNHAALYGVGLGLNWFGSDRWSANAVIAAPVGPQPTLVGTRASARVWVQVLKGF